ncbi:hypothetical protein COV16_03755 [Candidatus Woesearchaeota archaeon CG10_big_fil_rev_8_21_14_0_10_34_8]|nr:MAG: hypothetical protein COV16_03755 [Candidatus Woesearchaeota archaeon CG10_big_fil_rev_8_21_14_0_10_34_8]
MPQIQQLVGDELVDFIESCINHAYRTYAKRADQDTNPVIARMLVDGKPVDHWYYRSDEWIDQPYELSMIGFPAYVGPADNRKIKFIYGEGNFIVETKYTEDIALAVEDRNNGDDSFLNDLIG